jgi:prepilin-type N-terminal cleavage/methylation domain-containing protein
MARRAAARRAMSLLELSAVVFIIGLVAMMAAARYGASTIADVGADGFARRIALDCLHARHLAIATGDNHMLRFTSSGGSATEYALYRRQGGSTTRIDEVHAVPDGVTVTTGGATDVEFNFTGEALALYSIGVEAPDRTISVTVLQVTGKAFVE